MRVVLTNFGTTGDIQPFLALALELGRHGHEPVMAFSPNFAGLVESRGLSFVPIGPDLQAAQRNINRAWTAVPESTAQMQSLLAPVLEALPQAFAHLRQVCQGADVLVSGPAQPAARMIHELTAVPFASVQLSNFGGAGPPALQQASAALINPFRAELGLPPLANPLTLDANSPQLALYAISRHILPRPAAWPAHYHLTGYFFLDDAEVDIDPALVEFMEVGQPEVGERPIIITFGSMAGADRQQLTDLFLEAVAAAGCRAVIQQDWHGLEPAALPGHVYAAGYVPHAWLFPRAACVVHHGGGGTAGAVFRAGVPSVFVPHGQIFDQYYLGVLAEELGCAGPAIPFGELTAAWLADAITKTMNTPHYHETAAALGQKIRAEPGVQKVRQLIEDLVHRVGLAADQTAGAPSLRERRRKIDRRRQYQQEQRAKRRGIE